MSSGAAYAKDWAKRSKSLREEHCDELNNIFEGTFIFTVDSPGHSSSNKVFKGRRTASSETVYAKIFPNRPATFDDVYNVYLSGEHGLGPKMLYFSTLWHYNAFVMVLENADDTAKRFGNFKRIEVTSTEDESSEFEKIYPWPSEMYERRDKAKGELFRRFYEATYISRYSDGHDGNVLNYYNYDTGETLFLLLDIETKGPCPSKIDLEKKAIMSKQEQFKLFSKMFNQAKDLLEDEENETGEEKQFDMSRYPEAYMEIILLP